MTEEEKAQIKESVLATFPKEPSPMDVCFIDGFLNLEDPKDRAFLNEAFDIGWVLALEHEDKMRFIYLGYDLKEHGL